VRPQFFIKSQQNTKRHQKTRKVMRLTHLSEWMSNWVVRNYIHIWYVLHLQ
jgi:hypothetical protein